MPKKKTWREEADLVIKQCQEGTLDLDVGEALMYQLGAPEIMIDKLYKNITVGKTNE